MTLLPAYPVLKGLAYPVTRTMMWSTLKQDSWSGKSAPIQIWSSPRRSYALVYEFLRSSAFLEGNYTEWETLEAFYNSCAGASQPFLFTDITDQTALNMPFGIGDGVTTVFQLLRSLPGQTYAEPVYAPRPGFAIIANGQVLTTGYSIGNNPGQIVLNGPPAQGVTLNWTGGFDWICRFDNDTLEFQRFMHGLYSVGKVGFTTVKL